MKRIIRNPLTFLSPSAAKILERRMYENNIMGGKQEKRRGKKYETCKGLRVHSAPRIIILLFSFWKIWSVCCSKIVMCVLYYCKCRPGCPCCCHYYYSLIDVRVRFPYVGIYCISDTTLFPVSLLHCLR